MTKDAICTRILELELEILRLGEMMEDLENSWDEEEQASRDAISYNGD